MRELILITYNDSSVSLIGWMEEKLQEYDIPHLFIHESMGIEIMTLCDEDDYCDEEGCCCEE